MSDDEPVLRVVRGSPSAEEIAALVAVVVSHGRTPAWAGGDAPSAWVRSARPGAGTGMAPGRDGDAWRMSGLPR